MDLNISNPVSAIIELGTKVLDKFVADPAQRDAAKLELIRAERAADRDDLTAALQVIVSDSRSADPWTSRARPSFLYVVYFLLLMAVPMGILSAFHPETAKAIAEGFKMWLGAIPDSITTLFGVVMTGYSLGRSWEKVKGATK